MSASRPARRLTEELEKVGKVLTEGEITAKAATEWDLFPPHRAKKVLEYAVAEKGLIMETEDGYTST